MFHVVLFEPEIPPNTGNIIRLCANTGSILHLVHPLGFELDDRRLRRAGLDYREWAGIREHEDLEALRIHLGSATIFACSTRGRVKYSGVSYRPGDVFVFGPETRGLPDAVLSEFPPGCRLRIPMQPDNRSLNLSNAVAVILYEAWRQQGFAGAEA